MEQNLEPQFSRGLGPQSTQQKSFPFSTEGISLPSKGLCYPEGHPLSKGEITIKSRPEILNDYSLHFFLTHGGNKEYFFFFN